MKGGANRCSRLFQHGLVAATEDLPGTYEWGCYEEFVNGADEQAIGTGYQNTLDIVNQGCTTDNGGVTAAQATLDAEINGYSDWHLPSIDELLEMYNTIGNVSFKTSYIALRAAVSYRVIHF